MSPVCSVLILCLKGSCTICMRLSIFFIQTHAFQRYRIWEFCAIVFWSRHPLEGRLRPAWSFLECISSLRFRSPSGYAVVVVVLRAFHSLLIDIAIFGESRKTPCKCIKIIVTLSSLTRGVVDSSTIHIVVFSRVSIPLILWKIFPFVLFLVFGTTLAMKIPVPLDGFKPCRVWMLDDTPLAVLHFTRFSLVLPNAGLFARLVLSASLL